MHLVYTESKILDNARCDPALTESALSYTYIALLRQYKINQTLNKCEQSKKKNVNQDFHCLGPCWDCLLTVLLENTSTVKLKQ
jgi:hypothetical protein